MAKKELPLGRGLDAIFLDNAAGGELFTDGDRVYKLRIASVEPRSDQPRKYFDEDALRQLADSISVHGVLQPILVSETEPDRYSIIAGERRWRAAKLAGLTEIPAIVLSSDEMTSAEISLIENIQRENLNAYEEAEAYQALISQFGLTQEELSGRIGKSRSHVANSLRLLDLPQSVVPHLRAGDITAGHARALLSLTDPLDIPILADKVMSEGLSVRAAESAAKLMNRKKPDSTESDSGESEGDHVDYVRILEDRARETLGRPVTIKATGRQKYITIGYEDNEDLEVLLRLLCGESEEI